MFPLGRIVATRGVLSLAKEQGLNLFTYLDRHRAGDWGDVAPDDAKSNAIAVANGLRILSSYVVNGDAKIWIITEADRSSTCLLLPDEY